MSAAPKDGAPLSRTRPLSKSSAAKIGKSEHYLDKRIRSLLKEYRENRWKEGYSRSERNLISRSLLPSIPPRGYFNLTRHHHLPRRTIPHALSARTMSRNQRQGRIYIDSIVRAIEEEQGDYGELLENEWPRDKASARGILGAILGNLKSAEIPKPERMVQKHPSRSDIHSMVSAQTALSALFKVTRHTRGKQSLLNGLVDGHQDGLWDLLAWVEFFSSRKSHVFVERLKPEIEAGPYWGALSAADILGWRPEALESVAVEEALLLELARLMLLAWMDSPVYGDDRVKSPRDYGFIGYQLSLMLHSCIGVPSFGTAMREAANNLDYPTLKRLSNSFVDHCLNWEDIWKGGEVLDSSAPQEALAVIVMTAQYLGKAVPRFFKLLHALTSRVSLSERLSPSPTRYSVREEAQYRLSPSVSPKSSLEEGSKSGKRSGLLKGGVLNVIIHCLSTPPRKGASDGISFLYELCYYPPMMETLNHSLAALSASAKKAATSNPIAAERWYRFLGSLDHTTSSAIPTAECQKSDWSLYHRYECKEARGHRIECELDASWISNQTRAAMLRLSERSLYDCLPALYRARAESKHREHFQVVFLDIDNFPMKTHLLDIENMLKLSLQGRPVFGDARSMEMFRRRRVDDSDSLELVASIAALGGYYVATLSCFRVSKTHKPDGSAQNGEFTLTMLNGYVKVLKRLRGVGGVFELKLPKHCLTLTSRPVGR
ncbi:hypothetical protein NMY22_g15039 [Coprinellus aureogranulatus]|nr:hypothetical protein NMY22_g15039 [Coprinellus aureogranulatus]